MGSLTRPLALLLCALSLGCNAQEVTLVIDLRTDLVAGAEFFSARVSLPDEALELEPVALTLDDHLVDEGVRLGELSALTPEAARRVRVTLLDVRGQEVASTELLVDNLGDVVATVVITRDCRGVSCEDAAGATRCLGGQCVEPECLTGAEESCPEPECTVDTDCMSATVCAVGRCQAGVCLFDAATDVCATDEFCEPADGCRPAPVVMESEHCEPIAFVPAERCGATACTLSVSGVSAAADHACAVDTDGSVWCWGDNFDGQLGAGDCFNRLRPSQVPLETAATAVAVGNSFTCALLTDTSIWCWGLNDQGQLGLGDRTDRLAPSAAIAGTGWQQVDAGTRSACATNTVGELHCWGSNREGQVGQPDLGAEGMDYLAPTRLGAASWSSVDVWDGHACGIQADGTLHCWGRNTESQLGLPEGSEIQYRLAQSVGTFGDWIQVVAAPRASCGRRADESLWCWGEDSEEHSSIGFGGRGVVFEPQQRPDATPWLDVSTSIFHGCGLRTGGEAWCWGRAIEGQLGTADEEPQLTAIAVPTTDRFDDVTVTRFSSFFVRQADGVLLATGTNCGLLGNGQVGRVETLTPVSR